MTPYLLAFAVIAYVVHAVSLFAVAKRIRNDRPVYFNCHDPDKVSVIRPLCGVEPYLFDCLVSGLRLELPICETLFCVANADDPAIEYAKAAMRVCPEADARILIGDDREYTNPKLNNMSKGLKEAKHTWILMADSNVLLPYDSFDKMRREYTKLGAWNSIDDWAGVTSSPPIASKVYGFGSELECAFLNTYQARWQLVADDFGHGFAQGKVMLWDRNFFQQIGGIGALASESAEDAAATKASRKADRRVNLVRVPFCQPLGRRSLLAVWKRQLRWARLRRASFPLYFAPELLVGGVWPALLVLMALGPLYAIPFVALWYGTEYQIARMCKWHTSLDSIPAMVVRDLLIPVLYIAAMMGDDYEWRGTKLSVKESV